MHSDQEISGDILLDLNIDALKELGITTFGKRYKIMQAITCLKEESSVEVISLSSLFCQYIKQKNP